MASIGIPISGSFTVDGSGSLQTLPQETFTWTGADATFGGEMTVATFKSFFVLDQDVSDGVATMNVSMKSDASGAFVNSLVSLLTGDAKYVSGTDPAGFSQPAMSATSTLEAYLKSYAQAQLDADIAANGIPNNVEAENITGLAYNEFLADASAGVVALWTNMKAADMTGPLNIIARQIPRARYQLNPDTFNTELMVQQDDVITFRFNVDQTFTINENKAAATAASGDGASGTGTSALNGYPGVGSGYGVDARAIDLKITLKNTL